MPTVTILLQILSKYWREITIFSLGLLLLISGQVIKSKKLKIAELKLQITAAEKLAEEQKSAAERAKSESERVRIETSKILSELQANPPKGVEATRKWALMASQRLEASK